MDARKIWCSTIPSNYNLQLGERSVNNSQTGELEEFCHARLIFDRIHVRLGK
jgi:hypothetical protein